MVDFFQIFEIPRRYQLASADLEKRYFDLSKKYHPDKFPAAREKLSAAAKSTDINRAYKALRVPLERAKHLLALEGYDLGSEQAQTKLTVPATFLAEMMEINESLSDALLAQDKAQIEALRTEVTGQKDQALQTLEQSLAKYDSGDTSALGQAAEALLRLRYFDRFFEQLTAHDDRNLDSDRL